MNPEQQARVLRRLSAGPAMPGLQGALWLLAGGLAAAAVVAWHPAWLMAGLLPAVAAWSSRQTAPYIRQAARALEEGSRVPGRVRIEVVGWSESRSFHATVPASPGVRPWCFEFLPLGWSPAAGVHDAELFMLADTPWPALVRTAQGLLYPRTQPRPAPD